jgi:hypothetical protein
MLLGRLDDIDNEIVYGWAADDAAPDIPVSIRIVRDGKQVFTGTASSFRKDLKESGLGSGNCAFAVPIKGIRFGDRVEVFASASSGEEIQLAAADLNERHLSRLFDRFGEQYREAIARLDRRLVALEENSDSAEKAEELDEIRRNVNSLEKRMSETDVYITRIDASLKKLIDSNGKNRPGILARLFGQR